MRQIPALALAGCTVILIGALVGWPLILVGGCGAAEIEDPYDGRPSPGHQVFASFEKRSGWVVDGADDPAKLTRSNARATHGARSLHVVAEKGTRRKVSIRRDVSVDLSGVRSVSVDAWGEVEGARLALAFVTNPDHVYHETRAARIPASWHTLTFRLDGPYMKTAETRWQHEAPLANARGTVRIIFVLYTGLRRAVGTTSWSRLRRDGAASAAQAGGADQTEVFLDKLTFEGPRAGLSPLRAAPTDVEVRASARRARVYGRFEIEVSFTASHGSPFDPGEIRVFADFQAPSGKTTRVPGFITRGVGTPQPTENRGPDDAASDGRWLVRYMPTERGRHGYHVGVQNRYGRTTSLPDNFLAERVPVPSPVRVSARDPRHFEYVTGGAFYPVGLNVAWASDFGLYFEKFAAAGGNLVRVWLAPWCLPVASRQTAGEIDLEAADRLAEVFRQAQRHRLRVQLVLAYHGEFLEGWKESPYSAANGGPCAVPAAFFAEPGARSRFKRLLRYVAARFATEPALFAWELMNEADLPPASSRRDVIAWHREMAGYLRRVDHVGRPVTASTCGLGAFPEIDELDGIDFLQGHFYRADLGSAVLDQLKVHARRQKPAFVGEFGGGAQGTTDQVDAEGVRLRAGLWLTLASPAAGTGMPWWWDTQIEPNRLYSHWIPISELARRIDRRGKDFRFVHQALEQVAEPRDNAINRPFQANVTPMDADNITSKKAPRRVGVDRRPSAVAHRFAGPVPGTTIVHGILSRTEGLLYFYDKRVLDSFVLPPRVLPEGARLTVQGLVDGEFEMETWEGGAREPSRRVTLTAEGGRLLLELPLSLADFAVYLKAVEVPDPGIAR